MRLKSIELVGFKSFAKKTTLQFDSDVTSIVGPNGSGKSNVAESFRFVLGEQSMKSMRGRRGEDLIWNGSPSVPRANRASVKLILDNADRILNLDFDEVTFERVVHRDGSNEYLLNGSVVRLRDIAELLAHANIGSSGHHIISQGEADRILSASAHDRREMIEDALGLTAYLYKREDAERKLEKTAENVREVEGLRRELSPHLKFLEKQVKKIEEGEQLRQELATGYSEYFKRESVYIKYVSEVLSEKRREPEHEKKQLDAGIERLRKEVEKKGVHGNESKELVDLERAGRAAREKRETLTRELGRIEGELAAHKRLSTALREHTIPAEEAVSFVRELAEHLEQALQGEGHTLKNTLLTLIRRARDFVSRIGSGSSHVSETSTEDIQKRKNSIEKEMQEARGEEDRVFKAVERMRHSIESEKDASREAERELFKGMARRGELEALLAMLSSEEMQLFRDKESFKTEFQEAGALLGRGIVDYESFVIHNTEGHKLSDTAIAQEQRDRQNDRRKKLERMKIKLEEIGTGNSAEVVKEHQETRDRDTFLARELADLAASSVHLRSLISDLTQTLETKFGSGIDAISTQFDEFFKLMFGGGEAKLTVVRERRTRRTSPEEDSEDGEGDDEEEFEEGIDISVTLPHKRVKGLHMLSGGERALTSIALIFAMSQVNPPPFLILDETDAALDEANSRRYGDMIETLARRSQLILITHNRETMSRAGVLYGITMGSDGVSKLLSVKFEEAIAVAK